LKIGTICLKLIADTGDMMKEYLAAQEEMDDELDTVPPPGEEDPEVLRTSSKG
jgi:hypothetical protein